MSIRLARAERQRGGRHRYRRVQAVKAIISLIQRHTVVIARKRSAIVSIFFIDMPFLFVRVWLYFLSMRAGQPHFPGLGAKNGVCLFLNILQFFLCQSAGAEGYSQITRLLAEYRYNHRRKHHAASPGNFGTPVSRSEGVLSEPRTDVGADTASGLPGLTLQSGAIRPTSGFTAASSKAIVLSGGRSPAMESDATPHSGSTERTTATTPQHASSEKGSPHIRALQRDAERKGVAETEHEIRRETRHTANICTHFWALALAFGAGLLAAQAEDPVRRVGRWMIIWNKDD